LERRDVTEAELYTLLTESGEDNLLFDPIDRIVQVINSIHFDGTLCPKYWKLYIILANMYAILKLNA